MKSRTGSKKIVAFILAFGVMITMNFSIVSAAIVKPGRTDQQVIDYKGFTKETYLEELKNQGAGNEIIPVVWEPIADGVDLKDHPELGNKELAANGIIDVTAAPFLADPTGATDSTKKLQDAIEYGVSNQLAVFFPSGTYLVSDTLLIHTGISLRSNLTFVSNKNEMPPVLIGSTKGTGAKIKLADSAPGFNDPSNAKVVLQYRQPRIDRSSTKSTIKWFEHASNLEGNLVVDHLNIETGKNNPGAIGIHYATAEGAVLQDVNVNATGSLCGIIGGSGNGGSWTNISVTGGKFGIDTRIQTILTVSMQNITLQGQTHAGWMAGAPGTTVATGVKITADYDGPAIIQMWRGQPFFGSMNLIDSEIIYTKPYEGAAIAGTNDKDNTLEADPAKYPNHTEIPTITDIPKGLYLNNVYIKNAATAVYGDEYASVAGNPHGWIQFKEYAFGREETWKPTAKLIPANTSIHFYNPVYVDKSKLNKDYYMGEIILNVAPPSDLESRHGWSAGSIPTFETPGVINVKTAYGAKGDGKTDDTAALQKAIDENDMVFLPKGYYRISNTLKLKPNTKLFGLCSAFSTIFTDIQDIKTGMPFGDPANPKPLVETADKADASTIISNISITPPKEVVNDPELFPTNGRMPVYAIKWQSGGNSLMRSVQIEPIRTLGFLGSDKPGQFGIRAIGLQHEFLLVTGNGGGKIYNVYGQHYTSNKQPISLLAIKGTKNPITFYATEWQYLISNATVSISDSKYVTFYGLKTEDNTTFMAIKNSDHIRIFGHSGNGTAPYGDGTVTESETGYPPIDPELKGSLFKVENVPNLLITNLDDQVSAEPTREISLGGLIRTNFEYFWPLKVDADPVPSNERPVMYKVGNPQAAPAAQPVTEDSQAVR